MQLFFGVMSDMWEDISKIVYDHLNVFFTYIFLF